MTMINTLQGLLSGAVGNNLENKPEDVRAVKRELSKTGLFMDDIENPYVTREMDDGIKVFQKDRGLKIDGRIKPGGETEIALFSGLQTILPTRKPTQADIFHTKKIQEDKIDDRQVHKENLRINQLDEGEINSVYPELILIPASKAFSVLKKLPRKQLKERRAKTHHGIKRVNERSIKDKEIYEALKSSDRLGNTYKKTGKYGTIQKVYKGENGVTVIIETEGRNKGKIITLWKDISSGK